MLFGATPFAATTFAGVGAQNIVLSVTGNRLNVSIGNATAGVEYPVVITGNRLNLATGTISVVSWDPVDPNVNRTWTPIDPLNQ